MTKKYVLTKEKKVEFGLTFFRIKANVSFGIVAKGELGERTRNSLNLGACIKGLRDLDVIHKRIAEQSGKSGQRG